MPPIFQPEVIASAALRAAETAPRELWIAGSAIKAIVGQRLAPEVADRYLATHGYTAQQTDALEPPNRPDNVDAPLPGDRGAHGRFDARARSRSLELWLRLHPGTALLSAAALAVATGLGLRAARA